MSSDSLPSGPNEAANVDSVRIEDEMEQSYIDYAMSVIAGRALPDVRDGLKPVHRRILFAMHEEGVTANSGHRKSSSVVGDTMGDYHPHGDSAIYDALARMAQEFSMRAPLVDGQGNFGSVDGDPPAAMRYTEARMSPIAGELLADIEKDTVDFVSNYDDRLEEPDVLPSAYPNLLVNGSSGIAVGMSTNVPPHNLGEVIDATIHLIENPNCTIVDLMAHVKGPDFPTGAEIVGREAIHSAYTTGRGRVRMRASYEVEERSGGDRIVITELPYQQNKAKLVEHIADLVGDGTLDGVSDLRDESDRDGIRIVVDLKRGALTDVIENQLLEHCLEKTFGAINLALVDGEPQVLDLKKLLGHYLDHRREVVRRRTEYNLDESEERAHILEGRLTALENAEDVIERIRDAEDRDAAKTALRSAYDLSKRQADHVVRMQLGSLTALEAGEIETEYGEVEAEIDRLETILASDAELDRVITEELRDVKNEYADDRRTTIVEDYGSVTSEDLIPDEEVVVVMTENDYIKRMPVSDFEPQGRGGKGIIGTKLKEGDRVTTVFRASTHDYLLCFTNQGYVYRLKVYEIPEMGRTARGKSAINLVNLDDDEDITAVVATDDLSEEECLTMVTREGYVKRTCATDFSNIHSGGLIATRLEDGDELVDVEVTGEEGDLLIGTRQGMAIRFPKKEAREMGRSARGVNAMRLTGDDAVVGVVAASDDRDLLTVTENGYGKRTPMGKYGTQSRYGKGLKDIKTGERNGRVRAIASATADDDLVVMSEGGQIMRTRIGDISTVGRNTMGVTVMNLAAADRVACLDVFPKSE